VYGTVTANANSTVNGTLTVYSTGVFTVATGRLRADGGDITISGDLNITTDDLEAINGGYISILGPDGNATVGSDVEVNAGGTFYVSQNGVASITSNMDNNIGGASQGFFIIDGTVTVTTVIITDTTPDSSISGFGTINSGSFTDGEADGNFTCALGVCTGSNPPLPVELTLFMYELHGSMIHLMWSTASELNNFGFYVEQSLDGKEFYDLSFIQGNGTSSDVHDYKYTIQHGGSSYYRLRQVDFDGTTDYSKMLFVPEGEMVVRLSVYPNPTSGRINIPNGLTNYALYSQSGSLIQSNFNTTTFFAQEEIVNTLERLEKGMYILMSVINGQSQSVRIIKD